MTSVPYTADGDLFFGMPREDFLKWGRPLTAMQEKAFLADPFSTMNTILAIYAAEQSNEKAREDWLIMERALKYFEKYFEEGNFEKKYSAVNDFEILIEVPLTPHALELFNENEYLTENFISALKKRVDELWKSFQEQKQLMLSLYNEKISDAVHKRLEHLESEIDKLDSSILSLEGKAKLLREKIILGEEIYSKARKDETVEFDGGYFTKEALHIHIDRLREELKSKEELIDAKKALKNEYELEKNNLVSIKDDLKIEEKDLENLYKKHRAVRENYRALIENAASPQEKARLKEKLHDEIQKIPGNYYAEKLNKSATPEFHKMLGNLTSNGIPLIKNLIEGNEKLYAIEQEAKAAKANMDIHKSIANRTHSPDLNNTNTSSHSFRRR